MSDPADALLELAWAERRLAAEGRLDELAELHAERDRLVAALPLRPAPQQVPVLQRALAVQGEVADLLRATRDAVAAELQRVDHGRATLRAYTPAGAETQPVFDATG
ncbi:MAG TPA: flagellar protein FliT [Solirubrobacteraceae bacterium]|nr:flagellar protein FliT [Solirubrobacteraceae bacterium]